MSPMELPLNVTMPLAMSIGSSHSAAEQNLCYDGSYVHLYLCEGTDWSGNGCKPHAEIYFIPTHVKALVASNIEHMQ